MDNFVENDEAVSHKIAHTQKRTASKFVPVYHRSHSTATLNTTWTNDNTKILFALSRIICNAFQRRNHIIGNKGRATMMNPEEFEKKLNEAAEAQRIEAARWVGAIQRVEATRRAAEITPPWESDFQSV